MVPMYTYVVLAGTLSWYYYIKEREPPERRELQ